MVPEGWKRIPLTQVAEIRTGVAKGKTGLKDPINVPYLRVANVQDGHIDLSEVRYIDIERHQLERYSLAEGDVLMTEGGDFDKLGRGDVWHGQISPCLNQNHVFAVRVDKEVLLPYFLASLSGSNYGKTYFLSCAKRSTNLASINSTQLKEFPVVIPPLPEQRKIAKILQTWDRAIATTEKLIDASKQQKKALMQQLLTGKKRFAGFEGEWEEVRLDDICHINPRKSDKPHDGLVSFISMDDVSNDAQLLRKTTLSYENVNSGFTSFIDKDVLVAKITPCFENGKGAHVDNLKNGIGFGSTEFHVLRAKEKNNFSSDFVYFLTNSYEFRTRGEINMQGSAGQKRVTTDYLRIFKVKIPSSLQEQKHVVSVFTASDKSLRILHEKLSCLKQEKKALMQQLLTGKRRVKIDE